MSRKIAILNCHADLIKLITVFKNRAHELDDRDKLTFKLIQAILMRIQRALELMK